MIILKLKSNGVVVHRSDTPYYEREGHWAFDIWKLNFKVQDADFEEVIVEPEHLILNCMTHENGVWTIVDNEMYQLGLQGKAKVDAIPKREKRDQLLKDTDWTQAKDLPAVFSTRWAEYRQLLRDMSANTNWPWNEFPAAPKGTSPTPVQTDIETL
jgi:hypothetical protein